MWSEPCTVNPDNQGGFSILPGEVVPIEESLFSGAGHWLGIRVDTDPEMTPRARLASASYAFSCANTGTSGRVDDGSVVRLETDTDNVGIDTATPGEKLEVDGNILVNGIIKTTGFCLPTE